MFVLQISPHLHIHTPIGNLNISIAYGLTPLSVVTVIIRIIFNRFYSIHEDIILCYLCYLKLALTIFLFGLKRTNMQISSILAVIDIFSKKTITNMLLIWYDNWLYILYLILSVKKIYLTWSLRMVILVG